MITRAELNAVGEFHQLPITTVQKDYVLGWILASIAAHPTASEWSFKGGTCLKKCYFETYRFSEDLDFTLPGTHPVSVSYLETTRKPCSSGWKAAAACYSRAGIGKSRSIPIREASLPTK